MRIGGVVSGSGDGVFDGDGPEHCVDGWRADGVAEWSTTGGSGEDELRECRDDDLAQDGDGAGGGDTRRWRTL